MPGPQVPASGTPALPGLARGSVRQEPGSCQAALWSKAHVDPAEDLGPVKRNPGTSSACALPGILKSRCPWPGS